MKKLMSVIVAAMFAVSTAFVAAPVGAQPKEEKPKAEQKKGDGKKKAEAALCSPARRSRAPSRSRAMRRSFRW